MLGEWNVHPYLLSQILVYKIRRRYGKFRPSSTFKSSALDGALVFTVMYQDEINELSKHEPVTNKTSKTLKTQKFKRDLSRQLLIISL